MLDRLFVLHKKAVEQAKEAENADAILELCATLGKILCMYSETRNKIYGGIGPEREVDAVINQLEDISDELKRFENPEE